jgi:hypothetical protein
MTDAEFRIFAHLVLGLDSTHDGMGTGSEGQKQRNRSFVNMLLADFPTITNLHPVIHNEIADDQQALACALACCTLLLLGSDALTPSIIQRVWGANDAIRKSLGGPCGDLALIQRCLVLLSKIAINTYHLWATTNFDNARIINDDTLRCHPPGLRSIIHPSRIPILPNTFVRPWHQAPHALTFCSQTSGTVQLIPPPSPLRMPQCPGIVTSSSTDALPQTLLVLRTGSSRRLTSPLLHTTLHNIFTSIYVHVLCLHLFYVLHLPHCPFDKADLTMAFAECLSWHRERRMQAQ